MADPVYTCEVAWVAGAYVDLDERADWTDLSDRLGGHTITRGRTNELDAIVGGAASITLDNADRAFDPDHVMPELNLATGFAWTQTTFGLVTFVAPHGLDIASGFAQSIASRADGFLTFRVTLGSGVVGLSAPLGGIVYGFRVNLAAGTLDCQHGVGAFTALAIVPTAATVFRIEYAPLWVRFYVDGALVYTVGGRVDGFPVLVVGANCGAVHTIMADVHFGVVPFALLPHRQIRIRATYGGVVYDRFRGYVDTWGPLEYDTAFDHADIVVACYDALALLARQPLTPTRPFTIEDPILGVIDDPSITILGVADDAGSGIAFPRESTGSRVGRVLDLVGWPATLRDVDDGVSFVDADAPDTSVVVLDYLQRVARAEVGTLYVAANGKVTFRERRAWTAIATQRTSQLTVSDQPGTVPYADLSFVPAAIVFVKNTVTRANATLSYTTVDAASVNAYGPIEDSQTDLLNDNADEVVAFADEFLSLHKAPAARVQAVTLAPESNAALWPAVLGLDLGDQVTVERTAAVGDPPVARACRIEQVSETVDATPSTRTTWALAPIDVRRFFTIGDVVLGVIDDPSITIAA